MRHADKHLGAKSWLLTLLAVLAAVFLFLSTLTLWQVWHPQVDPPQSSDAVMVLAASKERRAEGRRLVTEGYSDNLVQSVSSRMEEDIEAGGIEVVPPEDAGLKIADRDMEACDLSYPSYEVFCVFPDPDTTIGEARGFAALAEEQGWDSVLIVTEKSHASRAKRTFERYYPGEVHVAVAEMDRPWFRNIYRSIYEVLATWRDYIATPD